MGYRYESNSAADEIVIHERCPACEVHAAWSDSADRSCARIEIAGAHLRLARIELDGSLTIVDDAHGWPEEV